MLCNLSPEVRRFGSIPWLGCLCAAAYCEMNGIYTSMVLRRNECCFHVRKAVVWRRIHFTGLDATSLWCSTERTLSGLFVSPAALQFLLFHRFVSRRHGPFAN